MLILLLVVLIGIFVALFATQNTALTSVSLLGVPIEDVPLYIVVLASMLLGVIVAWLISLVGSISSFFTIARKERAIKETQHTVADLEHKVHELEVENARLREQRDHLRPTLGERLSTATQR